MRFMAMRELKINPSAVLDRTKQEDVVVTRNGKPTAIMMGIDEDLLEEYIIAKHPTLLREAEAAWEEYKQKGGTTLAEMKRKVGRKRG